MAIGLFIAAGTAVLGTSRAGEEGLIDQTRQAAIGAAPSAARDDPWLAPTESLADHLALHAVAGPRMADGAPPIAPLADRDPFWALTSPADEPAPFDPAGAAPGR
ncbi:hypothetical protein [Sphingomonas sp. 1P08PE]|uniref:hypothetical protein n=1 Tax=Sphingomonas sp. 1P08PE TaxID=554122 RepID=UPI00399F66C1